MNPLFLLVQALALALASNHPHPEHLRCISCTTIVIHCHVNVHIPPYSCLYCKCPRPKGSTHQFCTHCGSRLPPLPEVDPSPPLQVAVCSNCRAHVPLESTKCVVCEHTVLQPSPIPVIQAQIDTHHLIEVRMWMLSVHVVTCIDFQAKLVCLVCGTRNRADSTHCWTCEKPLPPDPTLPSSPTPAPPPFPNPATMRPISGSSYVMCGLCGRVNVSDARFCDWCGSKVRYAVCMQWSL